MKPTGAVLTEREMVLIAPGWAISIPAGTVFYRIYHGIREGVCIRLPDGAKTRYWLK